MTACFIAAAAVAALWLISEFVKTLVLTPISFGGSTQARIVLSISGSEPELEYTLRSLIWLRESGALRADIHISAQHPDADTRAVAEGFRSKYRFVNYTEEISDNAGT